ncbi:MAG: site-specific integrase [Clostridia bacterium]|nr:site-specific integrase [Clostridia bacterium]
MRLWLGERATPELVTSRARDIFLDAIRTLAPEVLKALRDGLAWRCYRLFAVEWELCRDPQGWEQVVGHYRQRYGERVLLADKDLGTFVEPSRQTLHDYLDEWLRVAAKPRVRERTYRDYEQLLRRYVRPALGSCRLAELSPVMIQDLYTRLTDQGLSPRTVRYVHSVLHNALQQAVKWRLLPQNPAKAVDLPRQKRQEMSALSQEEANRFLAAAEGTPHYTLFLVAITTGMRPSEYLALQWKDVDLKAGTVSVRRTLTRDKAFAEPKTARSRRVIRLLPSVVQALRAHRTRQVEERLAAGARYQNLDLVFATPEGRPLDERNLVRRHFKPLLRKAGLPETIRLYDLRHTCATLLLAGGEHPKVVSERLGHASVTLTLDTYSHVLPDMQQTSVDILERLLAPKGVR